MKTINLGLDDATLAKVEKFASLQKTTVPELIRNYLVHISSQGEDLASARQQLLRLSAAGTGEVGSRSWTREDVYDR